MHRLAVLLAVPVLLGGCRSSDTSTTATHDEADRRVTSPSAAPSPALACGTPGKELAAWAEVGLAPHPGPVVGTTLVPAATTSTGTWSVLGIERRYVRDDGTQPGGASLDFALVNDAAEGRRQLIPIAAASTERGRKGLQEDWNDVDWGGETLASGKRALAFAVDCLDKARSGPVTAP